MMQYKDFIKNKTISHKKTGFKIDNTELNPILFDFQKDLVRYSLLMGKSAIFADTGLGKCHGVDTPILMYDGTIKKVQNIKTGDVLMGDDSTPRTITSTVVGKEMMYKVTPTKGESFTCNESHILSLKLSGRHGVLKKDDIVNISIKEYLRKDKSFKHIAKLYRVPVNFGNLKVDYPYIAGIWIGDGTLSSASITSSDTEVINSWIDFGLNLGLKIRQCPVNNTTTYFISKEDKNSHIPNKAKLFLQQFINEQGKTIPHSYLISAREYRLELLAGLLDTDGYLIDGVYEILTKYEKLKDDILFLARSLGLHANSRKKINKIKSIKFTGEYYRIFISGNTHLIPCRVERKKAKKRLQKKDALKTGFKIETIGIDNYYGFTLTGNHLYLLGDFTVTHNTFMQCEWAEKVNQYTNKPILILAPLAVAEQSIQESSKLGINVNYIEKDSDVINGINITNYEKLSRFNTSVFSGIVLDESSILKDFTSSTRNTLIDQFLYTPYKLACSATPAPNDFMELGNHAEFLNVISRTEMLSKYFYHDGGDTSKWRLKGHAKDKFWEWVARWASVIRNPSDLGYDGSMFELPGLNMYEYIVESNKPNGMLLAMPAQTLNERRQSRKDSLELRCQKVCDLVTSQPNKIWLVWCDLNDESELLHKLIPESIEVKGSNTSEYKKKSMLDFANGRIKCLISKPSICGHGMNFQVCHNMAFTGLSDSYEQFYQAIRRCYRFGQREQVNCHIVISQREGNVLKNIQRKESQSKEMQLQMSEYTKKYVIDNLKTDHVNYDRSYKPNQNVIIPEWLKSEVKNG
jgi:hypothetical protein